MAYKFIQPHEYKGAQYILDTDRFLFHGRRDIILVGNEAIINTSNEFHVNASKVLKLNSPQTHIGPVENGQDPNNPAAKGEETVDLMKEIIKAFEDFLRTVYPATTSITTSPGAPTAPNIPSNTQLAQSILGKLQTIKKRLNEIKSKKVFIK